MWDAVSPRVVVCRRPHAHVLQPLSPLSPLPVAAEENVQLCSRCIFVCHEPSHAFSFSQRFHNVPKSNLVVKVCLILLSYKEVRYYRATTALQITRHLFKQMGMGKIHLFLHDKKNWPIGGEYRANRPVLVDYW